MEFHEYDETFCKALQFLSRQPAISLAVIPERERQAKFARSLVGAEQEVCLSCSKTALDCVKLTNFPIGISLNRSRYRF